MAGRPAHVPANIWSIGFGNMGGAIIGRWIAGGWPEENFTIIDPDPAHLPQQAMHEQAIPSVGAAPDLVLLAVKPQIFPSVIEALSPRLSAHTIVLSIMAGLECAELKAALPQAGAIIRFMPNMAVGIGKSVIAAFAPDHVPPETEACVNHWLAQLGPVEWLPNEDLLHLVTALSGSGPAFVFRFVDALAAGAEQLGMDKDQSARLALAMVEGAASLASTSPDTPAELAEQVASPGGTTRAGLNVLDKDDALNMLVEQTLRAAHNRSEELAKGG